MTRAPDFAQIEGPFVRRDIAAPPLGSKLCVELRHLRLDDVAKIIEPSGLRAVIQQILSSGGVATADDSRVGGGELPAASGSEGGAV